MHPPYRIELTAIDQLQASEEIDEKHARQLARNISAQQAWRIPLPIECGTGLIMDGNHRLFAARLLGLSHLPCVLLSYDDPRVSVQHWHNGLAFDPGLLQGMLGTGRLLPYKTTRHAFAPALPPINIALADLRQADSQRRWQG
ncbi:transcriptional regulator [Pseudomonas fontis]|nr:transcriptional regulator [Pseudomonas fontis]